MVQQAETISVVVHGLKPRPVDGLYAQLLKDSSTTLPPLLLTLPADITEVDVSEILQAEGYDFVEVNLESAAQVTVTEHEQSSYKLTELQIGRHTTLLEFHDEWTRRKGVADKSTDSTEEQSGVIHNDYNGSVSCGDTTVSFQPTLRVVKDSGPKLPLALGSFPTKAVAECQDVPQHIAKRGGLILPLWQSEALLLRFSDHLGGNAVKVSVKGVNAITGLPMSTEGASLAKDVQDYIAPKVQPWLDGVSSEPGVTHQFVAAPLSPKKDSTSPDSISNTEASTASSPSFASGLQFDFFRKLDNRVSFSVDGKTLEGADLLKTPSELEVHGSLRMVSTSRNSTGGQLELYKNDVDSLIHFNIVDSPRRGQMKLFIRTKSHGFFGGRSIRGSGNLHAISVDLETTIGQVGEKLKVLCGSNQGEPIFSLDSVDLAKEKTISDLTLRDRTFLDAEFLQTASRSYGGPGRMLQMCSSSFGGIRRQKMAMADDSVEIGKGEQIEQRIMPDDQDVRVYAKTPSHRVFVHTVSPSMYERLTGEPCPPSLATKEQYRAHGIPWLDSYSNLPYKKKEVPPAKDGKVWSKFLPEDAVSPLHAGEKKKDEEAQK